jgi:hypothetical protein
MLFLNNKYSYKWFIFPKSRQLISREALENNAHIESCISKGIFSSFKQTNFSSVGKVFEGVDVLKFVW